MDQPTGSSVCSITRGSSNSAHQEGKKISALGFPNVNTAMHRRQQLIRAVKEAKKVNTGAPLRWRTLAAARYGVNPSYNPEEYSDDFLQEFLDMNVANSEVGQRAGPADKHFEGFTYSGK